MTLRFEHDPEIDFSIDDSVVDLLVRHDTQPHRYAGVSGLDGTDRAGNVSFGQRIDDRYFHMAAFQAAQILDLEAKIRQLLFPARADCHEYFTRGGQPKACRKAFEKRNAQRGLDVQDLAVDSRRRDVQFPGCLSDRAKPSDHHEVAEETRKCWH